MATYEDAIEAAVKREREVLGKDAIVQVNNIEGVKVDEYGDVESLEKDGKLVLEEIVSVYEKIAGDLAGWLISRKLKDEGLEELDLPESLERKM